MPFVPSVTTSLLREDAHTNATQCAFTFLPPEDNGGAYVMDYRILWDEGRLDSNFTEVANTTSLEFH